MPSPTTMAEMLSVRFVQGVNDPDQYADGLPVPLSVNVLLVLSSDQYTSLPQVP